MIDPIMQVYDLLILQELDLKIRQANMKGSNIKSRGKRMRGGKSVKKREARQLLKRAKSEKTKSSKFSKLKNAAITI